MTQTLPPSTDQPSELPSKPTASPKPKRKFLIPVAAIALVGIGVATWKFFPQAEANTIALSGRLEADETDVGAKTPGRVSAINFREGDEVKRDQVVAQLTDEEVNAQLQGAAAQVAAARQQEAQAKLDIAVIDSQIQEAQLNLQQSKGDASGRIDQATSTVSAVKAQLSQANAQVKEAESQLRLAQKNRDRYAQLVAQGAINQQQFDQAQTAVETAQATLTARQDAVRAAQEQLSAAQGGLTQVQSTGLNPDIREAQLARLVQQRQQAQAKLEAAQANVKNALANQQQYQKRLDSFVVKSPIHGVVTARPIEPGAVVATGKTLLTIVDLDKVYLRGYIPEDQIGKVRVGQAAKVYLDSDPKKPLSAKVAAIDPKATFTPENIYFRNDRVKQVFGVKITIDDPAGFAKPGMPADGEIILKQD